MPEQIGVSVCIFSFNYETYIAQAIESVLGQKTTFPVEIIIGDDCSTDKTRAIATEYQKKYPGKIFFSFNEANIGGTKNWIQSMNRCRGTYIALLDGDDYFTDEYKLQKQYDILEKNKQYVLSFHSVEEKYDDVTGHDKLVEFEKDEYTLEDFLRLGWFIRTGSTFFRNGVAPKDPPEWVYDFPYRYDTILHVFLCMHGKAINIKTPMSVWRKHSRGMSYALITNAVRNVEREVALSQQLNAYTNYKHAPAVKLFIAESLGKLFPTIIRSGKIFKYRKMLVKCLLKMDYSLVWDTLKRGITKKGKTATV